MLYIEENGSDLVIQVKVPATTANMGSGFDCIGTALEIYNTIEVEEIEKGLEIEILDENLKGKIPTDGSNLIYRSMKHVFELTGKYPKGIRFKQKCDIPPSRGLGSSSACIIAGIIAGNEIIGKSLSQQELLNEAINLEGHPDNIAPAALGGMVVSVRQEDKWICEKINIDKNLSFTAIIPDFKLETKSAREVLPKLVKREDAIFNIGRAAMLVNAFLTRNYDNLNILLGDRLHQPYRKKLIPHMDEIFDICMKYGSKGVYLSGAGPTLMSISTGECNGEGALQEYFEANMLNWKIRKLKCDNNGAFKINKL